MMRPLIPLLLAALAVALVPAPSARAATVLIELWTFGPGNAAGEPADSWKLMASTLSAADNDGLAGYNIELVNINNASNLRPRILNGSTPVQGFTVGGDDLAGDGAIFAGQDSTEPSSILYHVAEPGFTGPDPSPLIGQNVPWGLPSILLATGAGPWNLVDFGVSVNANVWTEGQAALGGTSAEAAQVIRSVVRHDVPEPSSVALAVLSMASLARVAGRRRRRT